MNNVSILQSMQRFGSESLTFSTLQSGLNYFSNSDGGFVAYKSILGVKLILGDPVCAPSDIEDLLDGFLNQNGPVAFLQIHQTIVDYLLDRNFQIAPIGVENEIELNSFDLTGKQKRDLRHYRNRAKAGGIDVREVEDSVNLRTQLEEISRSWIRLKKFNRREMNFLVRPLERFSESGVRIFCAFQDDEISGFVLFDPIYRAGHCIGYTSSLLRANSDVPEGTLDYIHLSAIEQFRTEGYSILNLGLSPLHKLNKLKDSYAFLNSWQTSALNFVSNTQFIFNFEGLNFHKSRYRANEVPVFVATRSGLGWELAPVWRACGIV